MLYPLSYERNSCGRHLRLCAETHASGVRLPLVERIIPNVLAGTASGIRRSTRETMTATAASLAREVPGFVDQLTAENKAARTIQSYTEAVGQFLVFLATLDKPPTRWSEVTRHHVQLFITSILKNRKATTAASRYRSLQQFFKYLEVEEVIELSPMVRMKPPAIPEEHRRTLEDDEVRALYKACKGKDFDDRRDTAILSLFYDTGIRLEEMATIDVGDIDLSSKTALIHGKGGRDRIVGFEAATAQDIRRYLRARDEHKAHELPNLWVGKRGAFGVSGVTFMLRKRTREAGLEVKVHPHLFRHTAIDRMLDAGMSEDAVMRQVGHKTDTMMRTVYAQKTAQRRSLNARSQVRLRGRFS